MRSRPALADPARWSTGAPPRSPPCATGPAAACPAGSTAPTADLAARRGRVRALSPAATLARGYAVVQDADGARRPRPRRRCPRRGSASPARASCRSAWPAGPPAAPQPRAGSRDAAEPDDRRRAPRCRATSRPVTSWTRWSAGWRQGGVTLEESLALWERGEELARICQDWLDGARAAAGRGARRAAGRTDARRGLSAEARGDRVRSVPHDRCTPPVVRRAGGGPRGTTYRLQPRSTVKSGSVFSRTSSSVTPSASSRSTRPSAVTSMTRRSVMIRWTTPRPVRGSEHSCDDLVASRPWRCAPSAR